MLRPERPVARGARVLLVSGSPKDVSRSDVLLHHVASLLVGRGHVVVHVTLRSEATFDESLRQLAQADAVVVTSPVQTTDPDPLTSWLDAVPADGLAAKLALPLAVDRAWSDALIPVLDGLGATVDTELEQFLLHLADVRKAAA